MYTISVQNASFLILILKTGGGGLQCFHNVSSKLFATGRDITVQCVPADKMSAYWLKSNPLLRRSSLKYNVGRQTIEWIQHNGITALYQVT